MNAIPATTGDVALPSGEFSGAPTQTPTHLRILSHADWVEKIVLHLKQEAIDRGACDEETASRLVVVLTEAITNAIVHGNYELDSGLKEQSHGAFREALEERSRQYTYAGRVVDIRVDYDEEASVWTISDQGKGFAFEKVLKKLESDDPEVILSSGRGIAIMRAFLDEVRWLNDGRTIQLKISQKHGEERRQYERQSYTYSIRVEWDGRTEQAIGCDLSAGGMAFVTEFPIEPGTAVTVHLLQGVSPRALPGKVVRQSHVAGAFYHVGVQFDRLQDDL